jgi:S-adenosylmethionine-diacylglycerol 3-amino-3-carboxypropyl transferase
MNAEQITELWREISRVGQSGSRIIFRSGGAMTPIEKALPAELRRKFTYHQDLSRSLVQRDRSAIYGGFHLYGMH